MTIYKTLIELSKSHTRLKSGGWADLFTFNLREKTIKNGKTIILERGEKKCETVELLSGDKYELSSKLISETDLKEYGIENCKDNPYEVIQFLFDRFKVSVPSEHSEYGKFNFYCKSVDELTMKEMVNGTPRLEAYYLLEGYIMLASLSAWIDWEEPNHWFWQCPTDKKLIIYRNWIER